MILDERTELSGHLGAWPIGGGTGDRVVSDVIDYGAAGQNYSGESLYLVVRCETSLDDSSGATATAEFKLVSDSVSTLDNAPRVLFSTGAKIADTILERNLIAVVPIPADVVNGGRYLGILADVQGEALTAGAISAFLTPSPTNWRAYDAPNQE